MKLKYPCRIYDREGQSFCLLAKGVCFKVVEVDKKAVKITWTTEGRNKFGFLSHKQFSVVAEEEKKSYECTDCRKFGNCNIKRSLSDKLFGRVCAEFEQKGE